MGSYHPLKSVQRRFWELVAEGAAPGVAGTVLGVSERCGQEWFYQRGGVNPRLCEPQGQIRPRLTPLERDEITIGAACGESERSMARRLGRAPSTIMREIGNNGGCRGATGRYRARYRFGADRGGRDAKSGYRGSVAQARSEQRATRPRARKLDRIPELREVVEDLLGKKYSPQQIAGLLPKMYPDRPEMRVSHETIYKYFYDRLYVQGRGELRRELSGCLRTGRVRRKPRKRKDAYRLRDVTAGKGRCSGRVGLFTPALPRRPRGLPPARHPGGLGVAHPRNVGARWEYGRRDERRTGRPASARLPNGWASYLCRTGPVRCRSSPARWHRYSSARSPKTPKWPRPSRLPSRPS